MFCCVSATFAGCIVTKLDETARPAEVVDILVRHRLLLQFVAAGQRVPEDLFPANATYLIDRTLRARPQSATAFAMDNEEFALRACSLGVQNA